MVLATATPDGRPSSRMVLLKGFGQDGFVFFTNQASRKGDELAANPQCALLFPWHPLERQVRVEGVATTAGPGEGRGLLPLAAPRCPARGVGLGPVAPGGLPRRAGRVVRPDGGALRRDGEVPVPPEWGGYRVAPEAVEFWQGRPGRMHDRLVYRRDGDGWVIERLAP